jgi:hypothetical protein
VIPEQNTVMEGQLTVMERQNTVLLEQLEVILEQNALIKWQKRLLLTCCAGKCLVSDSNHQKMGEITYAADGPRLVSGDRP